jgi:transcriptional regulator with XRE-family HTH domain
MSKIYFEAKGEELLEKLGISKSEFARRMGIRKQNVKALFKTKNLETIYKAASVLEVPFELLVGYIEEPDLQFFPLDEEDLSFVEECEITENDVPTGDSVEDRRKRQKLIFDFYSDWKRRNPEQKRYNLALKEDINIRAVSIDETAAQSSISYLSTLAVLQLDAILANAWLVQDVPSKAYSKNQQSFERMLIMEYVCNGVGRVKMTVGVRRSNKIKVQYCITALDAHKIKQEAR